MAKLTVGEELISKEHEEIHKNLHLYLKLPYVEITFSDGKKILCEKKYLDKMTAGSNDCQTEEIQLTAAQARARPEFCDPSGE